MSKFDPRLPHTYPRRVLIAVTGLSPQIVTETLYALAVRPEPGTQPFVPTEIHLLTTIEGAERAQLALLSDDPGWFYRLRRDYHLPEIHFGPDTIHVLTSPQGEPLLDIRSRADNDLAADFLTNCVRQFTAADDCSLHVSLAGGRKTMGFYLGYALSLYGRPQDRLSHVLVSEPFESSWDFFYPAPHERIITTRDNKLADCSKAEVTLAQIPFVRLREGLPPRLRAGNATFTEVVAAANRALQPPHLVINVASRTATADGENLDLGLTELSVLLWLGERARNGEAEVDWSSREAAEEFLAMARRVMNPYGGDYARCEKAVNDRIEDRKLLGDYFEPQKSRVNKVLVDTLGNAAAARYAIARSGPRGASRYYLPLAPEQIEIRN